MKKLFLVLFLIVLVALLVACGDAQNGGENIEPEAPACVHEYVEVERIEPMPLKDGEAKFVCTLCEDTKVDVIPMTKKIRVLTIGNSFVGDALHYLWGEPVEPNKFIFFIIFHSKPIYYVYCRIQNRHNEQGTVESIHNSAVTR